MFVLGFVELNDRQSGEPADDAAGLVGSLFVYAIDLLAFSLVPASSGTRAKTLPSFTGFFFFLLFLFLPS